MKPFFTCLFLAISLYAGAQNEHAIPKERWLKDFFISDEFCAAHGLEAGETRQAFRVWNYANVDNRFQRVVDAIWCFSSPAEAEGYLKENFVRMSDHGEPVETKIEIPFATNLMVFRAGQEQRKLNRDLDLNVRMYYFLFTVKNYVSKVLVSSEKDITIDEAAAFAVEAAQRLNSAIK